MPVLPTICVCIRQKSVKHIPRNTNHSPEERGFLTAEILNRTGRSTQKAVLERLDAQDPELAEEVRNQMFVFDDIAKLTDREIQLILREVDSKDLAVALKGGSSERPTPAALQTVALSPKYPYHSKVSATALSGSRWTLCGHRAI